MNRSTWVRLTILVLALTLIAVACGPAPTAAPTSAPPTAAPARTAAPVSKGTIKIATQSPLSGGQSSLGEAIKLGSQLAVKQSGKQVTDLGYTLEVVPFDDQAKPDVGVANAKNLVTDNDILVVIGHLNSGVAIPSSEVYKDFDLAMISPANTNVRITDRRLPNVNRVCGRDDAQGGLGAEFALKNLKVKSAYVLHDKTAYGQGVAEFFRDGFKAGGGTILGFEGTEEKANFDPIITPIKAANPELVYFGGIYDQIGPFIKQLRDKGVKSLVLGADGMGSSDLVKAAGDAAIGVYYSDTGVPPAFFPEAKNFIGDFKKEFGKDPEAYAAQAYDATGIALKAIASISKDKKPTRKEVSAAIRATKDYKGITGVFTFDDKGDPLIAKYVVIKVVSSDPAKFGQNPIEVALDIPVPKGK